MIETVDFFVIGAGSGGVRAARIAAGHGASVMIAEGDRVGGTCVIRGCVPKKFSVYASAINDTLSLAGDYGWTFDKAHFDWAAFKANRDKAIDRLEQIYERNLAASQVTLVKERARLDGEQTVLLEQSGKRIKARHILLATGGQPYLPDLPGIDLALSSDDFFLMEDLPQKAIMVGGGYIAVELAGILCGLGVETHLAYRGSAILRGFDDDLRHHLTESMAARGIHFHFEATPKSLQQTKSGVELSFTNQQALEADKVFFTTGRTPKTSNLGLETVGFKANDNGTIAVDEGSTTSLPWLHAVGDITGRAALTPVAIREGHALADRLFAGAPNRTIDYSLIPTAVFSQPELATLGLSESEAMQKGFDIDVYKQTFRELKNTLGAKEEKVLLKMVVDKKSDTILGLHMIGSGAAEMIQLLGISVVMGAKKADFDRTMAVHPTLAEEWVTIR